MMPTKRQGSLCLLVQNACFHRNENFACGEMKTNKQQSVLFPAFTVPRVLKILDSYQAGGGGGGGVEARMTKLTAANQKPLILWCPNLVT